MLKGFALGVGATLLVVFGLPYLAQQTSQQTAPSEPAPRTMQELVERGMRAAVPREAQCSRRTPVLSVCTFEAAGRSLMSLRRDVRTAGTGG